MCATHRMGSAATAGSLRPGLVMALVCGWLTKKGMSLRSRGSLHVPYEYMYLVLPVISVNPS